MASDDDKKAEFFQTAMVPTSMFKEGFVHSVYSGQDTPALREMYSVALIDTTKVGKKAVITQEELDPHAVEGDTANNNAEHFFSVPPKVIEVTEPFTSKVVATQNGGKYIESHGTIIREIRVQGTSGLRPNKPLPASVKLLNKLPLGPTTGLANSIAGPVINRADRLADTVTDLASVFGGNGRALDKEERTGYDDVMKLRNIFRLYSDLKGDNAKASTTVMVWRNVKDADYWVVEPREFKLVQDSKSPMTYNYQINFRTISKFEYVPKFSKDPLADIRATGQLISGVQGATRELTNTLLVVAGSLDRLAALGVFGQELLMTPIINTIRGTSAIVQAGKGIPASFLANWERLENNLVTAIDTLEEQLNPNATTDYPAGSTVSAVSVALTSEEQEQANSYAQIINSLKSAARASRRVLTQPGVRASVRQHVEDKKNRQVAAHRRPVAGGSRAGASPRTGGDKAFLGNDRLGGSLSRAVVGAGETIHSLGQRLLGNRNRWKMLALVNDLKAPYISTGGEVQTLAPGDFILYPVQNGEGLEVANILADDTEKDQKGQNLDTAIERAYGRDIRLKSDAKNRTDFVVAAGGDLATVQGIPNVKQGIRLKFATEQGTLTVHPEYGASIPIGSKLSSASLNNFRLGIYATIISDPRISGVRRLDFITRGDILSVAAELVLKDTAATTTTAFKAGSL